MKKLPLIFLGWSKPQKVMFCLFFLLAFVGVPLAAYKLDIDMNNTLLWLTGLVLLAYTIETQGLRFEMVHQNEISIQPLLITGIASRSEQRTAFTITERLTVRNIGRGPALHVQIEDVPFLAMPNANYTIKFNVIDCIEAGKEADVDFTFACDTEEKSLTESAPDFLSLLKPELATRTFELKIIYEDVGGQKRDSLVRMGMDGIKLLRHGKLV